jgi:hypothetical protein
MDRYPDCVGRVRPATRFAVWGALLALELAVAVPASAEKRDALDVPAMVSEFRQICLELDRARAQLGAGTVSDEQFADRILDLFVRADSLSQVVPFGGWVQRGGNTTGTFALSRAVSYLIESLRENYVGIASKDGTDFVEADRAYQAAVAWRPDVGAAATTASR